MAFPPVAAVPSLQTFQMSYGGVTFGGVVAGSTYQFQSLDGVLDVPAAVTADAQRDLDQGEFIGLDVLPGRDMTIQQVVRAATAAALDAARQALGAVLGPAGTTEQPLYLQLASGTFACMARPRRHVCPLDINTVLAKGTIATTQFHASDPRWYAVPTKQATVGLPGPLGGLTFPVTFPASFGGGGGGGILQVTNAGQFEMRPVLIVTGPCTNPRVTNLTLPGAPGIGFNLVMATGDTLVIDTDFQSVLYFTAGSALGASRRGSLTSDTVWWNLVPGLNQIELTTTDALGAALLTVQSADAWVSL